MVVLATQDRLGYGKTFDEAMTSIFGDLGRPPNEQKPEPSPDKTVETTPQPGVTSGPSVQGSSAQQLLDKAVREFEEYQRLTSQGKLGEAGQKLEQHKRTLDDLKRVIQPKP